MIAYNIIANHTFSTPSDTDKPEMQLRDSLYRLHTGETAHRGGEKRVPPSNIRIEIV